MEFRMCPSCKQSVLDDEATECPFCGASMTGKGGSSKKAPSSSQPASGKNESSGKESRSNEKPASPSSGKSSSKSTTAQGKITAQGKTTTASKSVNATGDAGDTQEDVDPFAVDASLRKKTPQGRPKPSKGCTYEIHCPMCGTAAYVPEKHAGKDVRCLNEACMVGVFKVPFPEVKVVEEKKQNFFKKNIIWIMVTMFIFGGMIAGYILNERANKPPVVPHEDDPIIIVDPNKPKENPEGADKLKLIEDKDNKLKISESELISKLFNELSSDTNLTTTQDYKATSLQMNILLYLKSDQLEKANGTMKQLLESGSLSKSFPIHPYSELAFYYLAHNNRSEAESSVQKSLDTWNQSRDEWHTRNTVASGVQLIASLVAVDRIEDANKVLIQLEQTFQNKDKAAIESASLQTSFDAGYFDLTVELMKQLPFELGSKTGKIVIRSLESRGLREAALKWAEAGKTPAEKFSRRLELMQTHLFPAPSKKQESRIESLKPVISLMQPGEQALAWAHLGRLAQELQFPDIAQSCKQETELLIKQGPAAQQIPMPDVVETYLNRFNHQEQIYKNTLRTLTQLEYSLLLQKLLKNKEAWDSILEAVNFARVTSPDYLMVKSRYDEIANNESAIRKELETKLKIKAADWRVALPEYRRNMYVIHQEMEESQKLLSVVLVESIKAGFHEEAYKWFKEGEGNQLFNQGIIAPQIPGALSIAFEKIADKNRGTEFIQLENTKKAVRPSEWNIQIKTEKAVAKRDFKAIASSLKRSVTEEDLLTMIYTTIYVAKREEPSVYIEWLREIRSNDEYREKSLQFASAIYGMNGKGVEFYNTLVKSTPEGNEKIFAVKGLTQSLMERNPKPTSSADKK